MNQPTRNHPDGKPSTHCADLAGMAERELTALFWTVTELFGPEQAAFSANEWLQEVKLLERLPETARGWRLITDKVTTRIASRVNVLARPARSAVKEERLCACL